MKASGNTVLITGGGSGIGFALAKRLIRADNTVIVCGRDQAKLDAAQAALPGLVTIRADVTSSESRQSLADQVTERFSALNVLINNAGIVHVSDLTGTAYLPDFEAEIAINLMAPIALTSLLLPVLRRQPSATIVNVTTGYVFLPSARTAPYSATKTALHVMTRSLRFQLRKTAVRVVEVMPPPIDTANASHYNGAKGTPEFAAEAIYRGLVRSHDNVVFGVSRVARLAGRTLPGLAFTMINRSEERAGQAHAG